MDIKNIILDIETHPILFAVGFFLVAFFGVNAFKKTNTSPTGTANGNTTSSDQKVGRYEVFNQTYTYNPVVPVPPPTPVSPPTSVIPPTTNKPPVVGNPPIVPIHPAPPVIPPVPVHTAKYVTVTSWPQPGSTLWSIAQLNHLSLTQLENLNPQYHSNWNLIHPGDRIRVA